MPTASVSTLSTTQSTNSHVVQADMVFGMPRLTSQDAHLAHSKWAYDPHPGLHWPPCAGICLWSTLRQAPGFSGSGRLLSSLLHSLFLGARDGVCCSYQCVGCLRFVLQVRILAQNCVKPTAHLPWPNFRPPRALDLAKLGFCLPLVRQCELSHTHATRQRCIA